MTQSGLAFRQSGVKRRVFPAGSEIIEKPIISEHVNVYCSASWMPHMRIALGNTLPSVSDYAASFDCIIEPAVDRELA
jgi:hypothetical protein